MEQLILQLVANLPNFAGFILLYYAMRSNNDDCQKTNDKLLDFLIETRGLSPKEVREHLAQS